MRYVWPSWGLAVASVLNRLAGVVDIQQWLHADAAQPMALRHQRDRTLVPTATTSAASAAQQYQLVLAWWQALQAQSVAGAQSGGELPASAMLRWSRLGQAGLVLAGLLAGVAAALAAFAYDGRHPVNLLAALTLLVGIPGLFLLVSLALLPGRLPGLGWLQEILASLNIGQWLARWLGQLLARNPAAGVQSNFSNGLAKVFGGWQRQRSAASRVGKWLMLRFAQFFNLAFFVGAVVTLLAMVSFSDLAFGWSTTLQLDPHAVVNLVQASSKPWAAWLPDAAPSAQLVLDSQYLRAQGIGAAAPLLGGWWLYVLMCLLVYGLVPRLVFLGLCRWRLGSSVQQLLLEDEQVQQLLQRLQTPWVERQVSEPESAQSVEQPQPRSPAVPLLPPGPCAVLVWNQVLDAQSAQRLATSYGINLVDAPLVVTNRSASETNGTFAALINQSPQHLLVLTKSWEPPLLELHDFLQQLAKQLPATGRVLVEPLGLAAVEALTLGSTFSNELEPVDASVWQQSIASLQNPKILLATGHD